MEDDELYVYDTIDKSKMVGEFQLYVIRKSYYLNTLHLGEYQLL
jgi:hypothetical protein